MSAREIPPGHMIAEAVEGLRLLGRLVFERAEALDQERREVSELIALSTLIDTQLDRIEVAVGRAKLD